MDSLVALEGAFLVERGLAACLELEALYCVPAREPWARAIARGRVEATVLPAAGISEIAGYNFHRGAYALARRPRALSPAEAIPAGT